MRRLSQKVSSQTVISASCALRQGVLAPERNRFFASCWLIVEPPATMRPFFSFFSMAFWMPAMAC